jgi:hypothetical protein
MVDPVVLRAHEFRHLCGRDPLQHLLAFYAERLHVVEQPSVVIGFFCNVMRKILRESTRSKISVPRLRYGGRSLHQWNAGANNAMREEEKFREDLLQVRVRPEALAHRAANERHLLPQSSRVAASNLDGGRGASTHSVHQP